MILRVAKCKFGPLNKRYVHGSFESVEQKVSQSIDSTDETVKRGVLAGLDNSHSTDYKVPYVSDPVLVAHSSVGISHEQVKWKLEELDLWKSEFTPIEIPRTNSRGEATYAPGFKSLPRSATHLDRYQEAISDTNAHPVFTSTTDIEATVTEPQNPQRSVTDFATPPVAEPEQQ